MKTQNIIKGLLVLLMLSGCATNKKEEITPTPNVTVTPTFEPTQTPNDVVNFPQGTFEPSEWDIDLIGPLLSHDNYFTLIDDYYVFIVDGKYGVINQDMEIVLNPIGSNYPVLHDLDGEFHFNHDIIRGDYESYDEMQAEIKNTEFVICPGHGAWGQDILYDTGLESFNFKCWGGGPNETLDAFDSSIFENDSYLKYQDMYSVKEEENVDGDLVNVFDLSQHYGVVDNEGNKITEAIYEDVFDISGELIPVKKDGLWGYVDDNGVEVIPCIYQATFESKDGYDQDKEESYTIMPYYPYPVIDGRIVVKNQDDKYGVIDTKGNTLIDFEYDNGSPYFDNSVILLKDGEWSIIE